MNYYGNKIRDERKKQNLTQLQLSAKAGIAINSLRRYESGTRVPTIDVIEKIARALKVDESTLLSKNLAIHTTMTSSNMEFSMLTEYKDAIEVLIKSGYVPQKLIEQIEKQLPTEEEIKNVFAMASKLGTQATRGSLVSFNIMYLDDSERKLVNDFIDFLAKRKAGDSNASDKNNP